MVGRDEWILGVDIGTYQGRCFLEFHISRYIELKTFRDLTYSPVAPGVFVLYVAPDLLKPGVLLVVNPEVLDVVRVVGGVAPQDVGREGCEGDHARVLVMLDRVGSHPMPAMLSLQVPVVHGGVVLPADDHPPVPILVLDDGGDDVQGAAPGNVTDLGPGVAAGSVIVSLGSPVATVASTEHVDSPFHLKIFHIINISNKRKTKNPINLNLSKSCYGLLLR